ncbi:hypothetical protein PSELUDRAFT_3187 [Vogesella sp. LIG4]|nr:hypothetical protein PSELUDRAFT_3187 [Vogesella sp. LIG4]
MRAVLKLLQANAMELCAIALLAATLFLLL